MAVQLLVERILEVAVMVPAAERDLDEAHAGLDEPPGEQALPAEAAGPPAATDAGPAGATAAAARSMPYSFSVAAVSLLMSISFGNSPCMRKASS